MSKFYQAMPISDWQNGDAFRYLEASGRNPIDRRITTKYIEAEVYRKILERSLKVGCFKPLKTIEIMKVTSHFFTKRIRQQFFNIC